MTLEVREPELFEPGRAHEALRRVRAVPDHPVAGVTFQDVTPLLADGQGLHDVVEAFALAAARRGEVDLVVGMEARGFLLGAPLALRLGTGFVPLRKAGKLPPPTRSVSYELEYGSAELEVGRKSIPAGARVLVVDDVLATGGTAEAACALVEQCGARVVGVDFLLEIDVLAGRTRLSGRSVTSLFGVPA
ncbi:adenine phosphoribosyltransferase [Paraoerskovia marina]|uniref:Adenine phosphoribosyltransferase n=1 Tax=Paraoerskovia marina TaxID=545619 RepID=A0A1H1SKK9_9CELL|nr:adenine phosphoribosyltransferase [Paraoerskovia marina]SDS48560.1 adenine phosphoribosyltransferase [Paraoerskovia marina]